MKKQVKRWLTVLSVLGAMVLGIGLHDLVSSDNVYEQMNKFRDVIMISQKYHVDEVKMDEVIEAAIGGAIRKLDPHSSYIPARHMERVSEEMSGKFQGVGLQIRPLNDTIIVVEPIGGGPAARLGIRSNDRIVMVNDTSIIGFSSSDAAKRLRGPKGTKVKVHIVRAGVKDQLVYEITRDDISIYSVEAAILMEDGTGYVSVNRFSAQTVDELKRALSKLKSRGMNRLVLDLRNNPGGIMQQAVQMVDLFLDGGAKDNPRRIVYTRARRPEFVEEYFATSGQEYENLPLIILISNGSASASEIVAGAIQDWDRGLIVGETSFGKGLVQREWPLSDGSAFRLTIARYYTPSGRLIQRPYDGKDRTEYVREAYQREEGEGENIDHQLDVSAPDDTTRPRFTTNAGRVVYGGGGITPDYLVKQANLTEHTLNLIRRDLMYQYIAAYLDGPGQTLRQQFGDDVNSFKSAFTITDAMVKEFLGFVAEKEVAVVPDSLRQDMPFIKAQLKAYVARGLWGLDGWASVMLEVDPQYKKAVALFPEAVRLTTVR